MIFTWSKIHTRSSHKARLPYSAEPWPYNTIQTLIHFYYTYCVLMIRDWVIHELFFLFQRFSQSWSLCWRMVSLRKKRNPCWNWNHRNQKNGEPLGNKLRETVSLWGSDCRWFACNICIDLSHELIRLVTSFNVIFLQ